MDDESSQDGRTRREYLTYGAAVATSGLLAGCTGDGDSGPSESTTDEETATATATETETTEAPTEYSVSIEPVGEVTFDAVPETWVANNGSWADMGIALGLEPPEGVWLPSRYHTSYYDEIPGVSVDENQIQKLWGDGGIGKEQFYALDADVHVMDPNFLLNRSKGWKQADVDEITEQIAPMFGNSIFSRGYPWHEDYRYYSLMEAFEKLAEVFQRTDRYEAFEAVHDDFQANLAPVVPARNERPEVAAVWGGGDEPQQFHPYTIDGGTSFKHLTDLKVRDALADSQVKDFYSSRGAIDFETLLEVDPEVLLLRGQEAKTAEEFESTVVAYMENHEVASELTAVQNGDVYRAGGLYQGPITNLVVTQRLAERLYGADEQLYDPERVSEIVAGEL
jgi:iron complex transport system substrate-binding protein